MASQSTLQGLKKRLCHLSSWRKHMVVNAQVAEHKLYETSMNIRLHSIGLFFEYLNLKCGFEFDVDKIVDFVFDTLDGSTTAKVTYKGIKESLILGVYRDSSLSADVFFFCATRDMAELLNREWLDYFGQDSCLPCHAG
jgi:hypothetical protein